MPKRRDQLRLRIIIELATTPLQSFRSLDFFSQGSTAWCEANTCGQGMPELVSLRRFGDEIMIVVIIIVIIITAVIMGIIRVMELAGMGFFNVDRWFSCFASSGLCDFLGHFNKQTCSKVEAGFGCQHNSVFTISVEEHRLHTHSTKPLMRSA